MNIKKHLRYLAVLSFVALLSGTGATAQETLGIVTGGSTGTYIKIGQDLSTLLKNHNINLDVHESRGSLDNIRDVYKAPHAQLGIVQSDVLAFIASSDDRKMKKYANKIRMIYPLYNEEIHILATHSIQDFEDLDGKRIAIGTTGSGTYLTSKVIFTALADFQIEEVYISGANALNALKKREVDAMVYVAGLPVSLFEEQVELDDHLHLLPLTDKSIVETYRATSTIPQNTYDFLTEDVPTVAVKAVLTTYAYRMNNCQRLANISQIIESNHDWLRENGHPKWSKVDFDATLAGWSQYECLTGKNSAVPEKHSSLIDAISQATRSDR
ncbi:hypothetical protein AB833_29550 [Chromatiales bacterium (ex Bugula neritina AB1)]|nr:hypothetical protein AB833_29550 [Chromatiales bacterium (ex Bugula neritina AB1)]